jgi:hypothetical protein
MSQILTFPSWSPVARVVPSGDQATAVSLVPANARSGERCFSPGIPNPQTGVRAGGDQDTAVRGEGHGCPQVAVLQCSLGQIHICRIGIFLSQQFVGDRGTPLPLGPTPLPGDPDQPKEYTSLCRETLPRLPNACSGGM